MNAGSRSVAEIGRIVSSEAAGAQTRDGAASHATWTHNGGELLRRRNSTHDCRICIGSCGSGLDRPGNADCSRLLALIIAKNRLWFDYWRPQNWAFLAGDRTAQPSSRDHVDPEQTLVPARARAVPPAHRSEGKGDRRPRRQTRQAMNTPTQYATQPAASRPGIQQSSRRCMSATGIRRRRPTATTPETELASFKVAARL